MVATEVVETTDKETLQGFVEVNTEVDAEVYTDGNQSYATLNRIHLSVDHSNEVYVEGNTHTNGIESFWAMFKRGHKGTYHKMSKKHLHRYMSEFAGRHNTRPLDTEDQMGRVVRLGERKCLRYTDLIGPQNTRLNPTL